MREKLYFYLIMVLYSFNALYYFMILSNPLVSPLINSAQDYEWTRAEATTSTNLAFTNYYCNALYGVLEATIIINNNINNNTQVCNIDTTSNSTQVSNIDTTNNNTQVSNDNTTNNNAQVSNVDTNNDNINVTNSSDSDDIAEQDTSTINSSDLSSVFIDSAKSNEVLILVNEIRISNGNLALTSDSSLDNLATKRALEISQVFSHTRPNGSDWSTIMSGITYSWSGENLAYGQYYPSTAVNSWLESPSHADNIFNSNYTKTGISCVVVNDTSYWVQLFSD